MRFFQTVGIILSFIILIVVVMGTMYLSYIIGLGILILGTGWMIYKVLGIIKDTKHLSFDI